MSQIPLLLLAQKIWEIIRKFSLSTAINKFQRPLKICQENNLRSTTRSSALRKRSHSMPAPCHPLPGPTTSSRTRTSPSLSVQLALASYPLPQRRSLQESRLPDSEMPHGEDHRSTGSTTQAVCFDKGLAEPHY